jgi:hypothetical protein
MSDGRSICLSSGAAPESSSDTRSVLIPHHIAPSHKDRALGRFSGTARFCFFGLQKIFLANYRTERGAEKDFPNLPKMRRWALGAGHTRPLGDPSTLRANPIPEDIPMNPISLTGVIVSVPRRESIGDLRYTIFGLWIPGTYRNSYAEEYSIICIGKLDRFARNHSQGKQIEVQGQLRGLHCDLCLDWPDVRVPVEVFYPRVIANSIRRHSRTVSEAGGDELLLALDQPELA